MGKSSSSQKQVVVNYYMSLMFGIACGADRLRGIYIDGKTAWTGDVSTETAISINQPNLFGGVKKEGGAVGTVHFLPGGPDQVMPEHLAARFGRTSATCPAYRGIASIFFHGGSYESYRFSESPNYNAGGFLWSSNKAIIAQTVEVEITRAPKGLDPDLALIGNDANPAHVIYECLTNTDWGLGAPGVLIDTASFAAAAETLHDESFGLSMIWTKQAEILSFIGEVLDHIQGAFYTNPRTGLYTLKLFRDDYDASSLRKITPDNAKLVSFSRKMWGETVNEIAVSWTNPENEESETVTAQNLSLIEKQGAPASATRDYYGIRNRDLAQRVAERDLRTSSAPLAIAEYELDRSAWDLLPGEVVELDGWPDDDQVNGLIMRATTVDYGTIGQPVIRATFLEDVFSLERPGEADGSNTNWTPPGDPPAPMAEVEIITLPQFMVSSSNFGALNRELVYPEVIAALLAHQPGYDTATYDLLSEQPIATGEVGFRAAGTKATIDRALTGTTLPLEAESVLTIHSTVGTLLGPQVGGFAFIGEGGDEAMEVALIDSYDGTQWTLQRGVLDTVPQAWPIGTPIWYVSQGKRFTDDQEIRSAGESPDYKLLSRTSLGALAEADAPTNTGTLTARPHLPLRPGNVKINGNAWGPFSEAAATDFVVTWATRNRLLEDGQIVRWTAGAVGPEYTQGTVLTVYDQDDNMVFEQPNIWTETEWTLPKAWFARYSAITVKVTSRRTDLDLDSLQGHSITITGLPNNPAADLPPAPVDTGYAPSFEVAPALGAWVATAHTFDAAMGAKLPGILVSGQRDRTDAAGLNVRYRQFETTDWFYVPEVALSDAPTQSATSSVAASTAYEVEIAYRGVSNILSLWRSLGAVTTGQLVAADTASFGDVGAQALKDALARARQLELDLVAQTANAQLKLDRLAAQIREAMDGKPLGPVIAEQRQVLADTKIVVGSNTAAITAEVLARQTAVSAEAFARTTLQTSFDSFSATATSQLSSLSTAQSATAASVTTLSGEFGSFKATAESTLLTHTTDISSLSAAQTTLSGTVAANKSSADSSLLTLTTNYSALAAANTSLTTTVNNNHSSVTGSLSSLTTTVSSMSSSLTALNSDYTGFKSSAEASLATLSTASGTQASAITTIQSNAASLSSTVSSQALTLVDVNSKLAVARFVQEAAASGGLPARMTLYSDNAGSSAVALTAKSLWFGDGSVFDDDTDVLRTVEGSTAYVTAWGQSFGASANLRMWIGPSSVATSAMTRANAYFYIADSAPNIGGSGFPGSRDVSVEGGSFYGYIGAGVSANTAATLSANIAAGPGAFFLSMSGVAIKDGAAPESVAIGSWRLLANGTQIADGYCTAYPIDGGSSGDETPFVVTKKIATSLTGSVSLVLELVGGGGGGSDTATVSGDIVIQYIQSP